MKNSMRIEFVMMKKTVVQTLVILVIMAVCVGYGMSSVSAAMATVAAAAPYFFAISAFSIDAAQGWERYRAMLPFSREEIVGGRYASQLALSFASALVASVGGVVFVCIGQACGLVAADNLFEASVEVFASALASCALVVILLSIAMPIFFKSGMSRGAVLLPAIMVVMFVAVPSLLGNMFGGFDFSALEQVLSSLDSLQGVVAVTLVALVVMLAAYFISYKVSCRVYARRDL